MQDILSQRYSKIIERSSLNESIPDDLNWPSVLPKNYECYTFNEIQLINGDHVPLEVMYEICYCPDEYEYFNDKRVKVSSEGCEIKIKKVRIPTNRFQEELDSSNEKGKYKSGQEISLDQISPDAQEFITNHLKQYHNR